MEKVAIVSAYRSAIGKFGGSLKDVNIAQLGADVVKYALNEKNIAPDVVDEVIMGNVLSAGLGQNIARQIAVQAGIPETTSAFAVNKVCGSGLKSVLLGAQSIMLGDNSVVVAGGIEVMSQAPYLSRNMRWGQKFGQTTLQDSILLDGLTDAFSQTHMGITAENVAEQYDISRCAMDAFAQKSQEKAAQAIQTGQFKDEIVPLEIKQGRNHFIFDTDESPRLSSLEKLSALQPAFKADGRVTAGNASPLNDGCAVVVLMSEKKALELGIQPLAYIESYATSGLDPQIMGMGPLEASQKALKKAGLSSADIDLFELNEAFAAQSIPVIQELGLDENKVNIKGGALALGHPIGASGTRILVTLVHALRQQEAKLGLCALCIGGGQGISLLISTADAKR